jgi:cysteinyl-tRNA synthetase
MKLYNTLTRKKEELKPVKAGEIGIYSCGPTVYWNQHIGHMYAYVQWDVMVRFLRSQDLDVNWVMNITDVGHLTSDEDTGVDKMEKGAKREGLSVWELAEKYTAQFVDSMNLLNIRDPDKLPKATEHIKEQIELAKKIEKKGFTYKTKKGLVFDTSKFADYSKFANLALDKQVKRKDVEDDPEKKQPWDFFLWVIDPKHVMKWKSPWGEGYPGWHLECTAMSTKYLGDHFDIHTGGIEHVSVHHTNEIAQGYGAFGSRTANYWLHNAWLLDKSGEKMSKSEGNFLTIQGVVERGYDPLALRYLFLTSHYRKGLKFSWKSLDGAVQSLRKLRMTILAVNERLSSRTALSTEKANKIDNFRKKFNDALDDDLNTPVALSVVWEVAKSNIPHMDKFELILAFDAVLGLELGRIKEGSQEVPKKVHKLIDEREALRKKGDFDGADVVRKKIEKLGYSVNDTSEGPKVISVMNIRVTK